MMEIMGICMSNICPYPLKDVESNLCVIQFKHPGMLDTFVEETNYIR